jgi:dihydroorotate dehydrogenase (NAD+) catalytic subunit
LSEVSEATTSPAETEVPDADPAGPPEDGHPGPDVDLSVELAGLRLANPVVTASGCFASGQEIDRFYDVTDLGAVVVKSITLEPREGLPTPRMAETPSGMLNAIGLQNPGVDVWLERDLPWLRERGVTTIVSIAGKSVDEYEELATRLRGVEGIAAVEVNISCPNVENRNIVFACRADSSAQVIATVKGELDVPVFAKLTPDVTDIAAIAHSVADAGADGVSLINTLLGMAIDVRTGRPKLANTVGGLSGPAIRPVAVRCIWQVRQALPTVPIIGMGGVLKAEDAVELMMAGADAVAVGTGNFVDPFAARDIVEGLAGWCQANGVTRVADLQGSVRPR